MLFHRFLILPALLLPGVPVAAQDLPQAVPTPSAVPSPAASPTVAPSPSPVPVPEPTPAPAVERVVEPPVMRPTPRPTERPIERASPFAPSARETARPVEPSPIASPTPSATTAPAAPPAIASPLPTGDDDRAGTTGLGWPWMLGAAALAIAGIGLWLARRQRTPEDEGIGAPTDADEPEAIVPPARAVGPVAGGATDGALALRFRPTRVGFNMLSATAEGELTLANEGAAAIHDVRVRTALLGAHVQQDADLADFLAEPMGRPAVPPFALQPGEARTVRVLAAAPRAALRTMTAADRPMFVPVLAVDVRVGGEQVAQAFAIGAERVDSAKLAPFWLDVPDRTYTEVAARPHGPAVVRQSNG